MKLLPLALLVLAALPIAARAEPSPIRIRVEQVNTVDNDGFIKIQHRHLKVSATNGGTEDKPALVVKFWIFGKRERGDELVMLAKGEESAAVKSHATEVVETKAAKARSTEAHYPPKKGPRKLGAKIPESGVKIVGHAVQVFDGPTMVAEAYEPLGMKEQIGKAKAEKQ